MKKTAFLLFLLIQTTLGQYIYRSPYLAEPERMIGYVDSCAKFWTKVYDPAAGGFYTNVDRAGNVMTSSGTNKNMISQSRDAYGFLRAFMLTGKNEYLVHARNALDFMYKSAWDKSYGGWHDVVDKNGNPTRATDNKTAFNQHYALLGITAAYETMHDTADWSILEKGLAHNEAHFWDSRPDYYGYYDNTKYDGTTPSGKSFNATVDAITTHLLHMYLMTGDSTYKIRLHQVAANMLQYLTASAPLQAIGFVEVYNTNWEWNPSETMSIMGHVLKTAWCFARVYDIDPDTAYLSAAERLVAMVLQKGYDHQNGGPYKDYNRVTGEMLMWGKTDTAKAWWQMEQAITAGLLLYKITGKQEYLEMADETLDFFMKYFVDRTYGEVYENRTKYGGFIWNENKGGSGKAGYHSTELGYYVYLYGSLLIHRQPVVLYYNFSPLQVDRQITLNPISSPLYRIQSITRNDTSFTDFDRDKKILNLPAGTGGKFRVTFEPTGQVNVTQTVSSAVPERFTLMQNYPNPFNPSTTFKFSVPEAGAVTLRIYDMLGREIASPYNGSATAGTHLVVWNAAGLSSGMYLARMEFTPGNRHTTVSESRKIVLMK
jgi:mannose/cellobiose epimerase-like protein (N-acyl-D-glucosamine 2-epimerase family)